jgi:hypothetical protein
MMADAKLEAFRAKNPDVYAAAVEEGKAQGLKLSKETYQLLFQILGDVLRAVEFWLQNKTPEQAKEYMAEQNKKIEELI